eukprot:8841861-Lingulodinium_polyedra.AAC.1
MRHFRPSGDNSLRANNSRTSTSACCGSPRGLPSWRRRDRFWNLSRRKPSCSGPSYRICCAEALREP